MTEQSGMHEHRTSESEALNSPQACDVRKCASVLDFRCSYIFINQILILSSLYVDYFLCLNLLKKNSYGIIYGSFVTSLSVAKIVHTAAWVFKYASECTDLNESL